MVDNKKAFMTSVVDFQAEIQAYDEIATSREEVDYEFRAIDVQASVLIFDTGKLEIKFQRNSVEDFLLHFVEKYKTARESKNLFRDYFDTTETRFDLLTHLSGVQAARRELEHQLRQYEQNLTILTAELDQATFQPSYTDEDVRASLELNLSISLDRALNLILDERRAFRTWTLEDYPLRELPANLTAEVLDKRFHRPLWDEITRRLNSAVEPAF